MKQNLNSTVVIAIVAVAVLLVAFLAYRAYTAPSAPLAGGSTDGKAMSPQQGRPSEAELNRMRQGQGGGGNPGSPPGPR